MALQGKVVKKRESSSDATLATPSTNEGGRAVTPGNDSSDAKGKDISDSVQENGGKSSKIEGEAPLSAKIEAASADVNTDPTEAQKEAGNYKKGHVQVGSFDIKVQSGLMTTAEVREANTPKEKFELAMRAVMNRNLHQKSQRYEVCVSRRRI